MINVVLLSCDVQWMYLIYNYDESLLFVLFKIQKLFFKGKIFLYLIINVLKLCQCLKYKRKSKVENKNKIIIKNKYNFVFYKIQYYC